MRKIIVLVILIFTTKIYSQGVNFEIAPEIGFGITNFKSNNSNYNFTGDNGLLTFRYGLMARIGYKFYGIKFKYNGDQMGTNITLPGNKSVQYLYNVNNYVFAMSLSQDLKETVAPYIDGGFVYSAVKNHDYFKGKNISEVEAFGKELKLSKNDLHWYIALGLNFKIQDNLGWYVELNGMPNGLNISDNFGVDVSTWAYGINCGLKLSIY